MGMMEAYIFLGTFALVILIIDIYFFFRTLNRFRTTFWVGKGRTTRIKDISPGLVILKGRVELIPGKFLHTPIEKIRVVHFLSYLQKLVENPYASRWKTIQNQIGGREFLLSDETGKLLIDPLKAELDISWTMGHRFRLEEMPPQFASFLKVRGIYDEWKKRYSSGQFRYAESILTSNEKIYVLGYARRCVVDEDKVFYQDVRPFRIEGPSKGIPFMITDGSLKDLKVKLIKRSFRDLVISIATLIPVLVFLLILISDYIA